MTTAGTSDYEKFLYVWLSEIHMVYTGLRPGETIEKNKKNFEKALDESIIDLVKYNQIKDSEKDKFKTEIMDALNTQLESIGVKIS